MEEKRAKERVDDRGPEWVVEFLGVAQPEHRRAWRWFGDRKRRAPDPSTSSTRRVPPSLAASLPLYVLIRLLSANRSYVSVSSWWGWWFSWMHKCVYPLNGYLHPVLVGEEYSPVQVALDRMHPSVHSTIYVGRNLMLTYLISWYLVVPSQIDYSKSNER